MKRMTLTILLVTLLGCGFLSCGRFHDNPKQWKTYRNRYLRVDYPVDYKITDGFDYGVDDLKEYREDISAPFAANELDILPLDSAEALPWAHIVLSRMTFESDLRFFAELSAFSKSDYEVSVSDIDSTTFAGYPAMSLTLEYPMENGDTLVQHQTIVGTDDLKLYYVNLNHFKSSDQEDLVPMTEALATLKLK